MENASWPPVNTCFQWIFSFYLELPVFILIVSGVEWERRVLRGLNPGVQLPSAECPLTSVCPQPSVSPVSGTVRPAVCATVSPWWRSSPCKELSILFSPRPQHCQVTSGVTAANIRNRNLEIIPTLGAECRALHSEIMMPDQRTSSNVQT